MTRTVIIRREYLHYVPKYNRYERRHKNLPVHVSPAFRVEVGDIIVAGTYSSFPFFANLQASAVPCRRPCVSTPSR